MEPFSQPDHSGCAGGVFKSSDLTLLHFFIPIEGKVVGGPSIECNDGKMKS